VENENACILRVVIVLDHKETTSILLGFNIFGQNGTHFMALHFAQSSISIFATLHYFDEI